MAIKLGNTEINKIYLGSTEINKAYLGNDVIYDKSSAAFLYDTYPAFFGISAARQLKTGITQVEELRRSSDNNEVSVDFDNGEKTLNSLVTGGSTLGTWSSATDAFSVQPYDQSGNSFVLDQSTASRQPQAISAGALVTSGGRPAWELNTASKNWIGATDISVDTEHGTFFIFERGVNSNAVLFGKSDLSNTIFVNDTNIRYKAGGVNYSLTTGVNFVSGNVYLLSVIRTLNNCDFYINGALAGSLNITGGEAFSSNNVGAANTLPGEYKLLELNYYKGDQSANRAAIEANINAFYNIY